MDTTKYTLSEIDPSDIDEVFQVMERAYKDDEVWAVVIKDVSLEAIHPWVMGTFAPRWTMADRTVFKITDIASKRIAGWTTLQYPWADRPLSDELKAIALSTDLPPAPEGTNMVAYQRFFESIYATHGFGYDPEKHFHRQGTMIDPDFQKQGLGTALTHHCNAIADKAGVATYVSARPTSIKMFNDNGFVNIGEHDAHLEEFGGLREKSITKACKREPNSA
ncbi:hypothetical protein B0O99DRAFT_615972 [Bisporella sp. PMI_857]|nr:hypothetical protein B0O99DRAFT_615972 [Bisporella sp. PMI_857]